MEKKITENEENEIYSTGNNNIENKTIYNTGTETIENT